MRYTCGKCTRLFPIYSDHTKRRALLSTLCNHADSVAYVQRVGLAQALLDLQTRNRTVEREFADQARADRSRKARERAAALRTRHFC